MWTQSTSYSNADYFCLLGPPTGMPASHPEVFLHSLSSGISKSRTKLDMYLGVCTCFSVHVIKSRVKSLQLAALVPSV